MSKYIFNQFTKSQLGQDLKVIQFYNHKRRGYYVEIGASDGIELSNTHLLEHCFNWKGICVEPIPNRYNDLVKNRPYAKCINHAVYDRSNMLVDFDIANNYDLLSGITDHLNIHKEKVYENRTWIKVNTITLLDLLDKSKAPKFIEYLSLDTEGSELAILEAFDFSKYTFGLIDVEHNYVEPERSRIRNLLERNGYVYIGENKWDDQYKHKSL